MVFDNRLFECSYSIAISYTWFLNQACARFLKTDSVQCQYACLCVYVRMHVCMCVVYL